MSLFGTNFRASVLGHFPSDGWHLDWITERLTGAVLLLFACLAVHSFIMDRYNRGSFLSLTEDKYVCQVKPRGKCEGGRERVRSHYRITTTVENYSSPPSTSLFPRVQLSAAVNTKLPTL